MNAQELRRHRGRSAGVVLLALLMAACKEPPPTVLPVVSTRDSAGVTIVESTGEAPRLPWRVSPRPVVVLGDGSDGPDDEFGMVMGAVRLSDGTIVVAENWTVELRYFDARGRQLRTVGRRGQGPGEFTALDRLAILPPDTVVAYDYASRRASLFTAGGEFARSFPSPLASTRQVTYSVAGAFDERRLWFEPAGTSARPGGPDVLPVAGANVLVDVDRLTVDTVGEAYGVDYAGGRHPMPLRFGRQTASDPWDGPLYITDGGTFEVRVYDDAGLRRIIRRDLPPRQVTQADIQTLIDFDVELVRTSGGEPGIDVPEEERVRRVRAMLDAHPFPDRMPAVGDVVVDALGYLWVAHYRPFHERDRPTTWTVFDPDGQLLGEIQFPGDLAIRQIDRDRILAIRRDGLNLFTVVLYGLKRGME